MQLIFDLGNTVQKCAVFENDEQIFLLTKDKIMPEDVVPLQTRYNITDCIISSVAANDTELKDHAAEHFHTILLGVHTSLPITNAYRTPETLGNDRLANAVAASALYPGRNVLIIDAGTCLKYDFISAEKVYPGGAISPGLTMRFRAMHNYTARLPLLNPEMNELMQLPPLTGGNTHESMLSGVMQGAMFEAEGYIDAYRKMHGDVLVLLTGGDMVFFEKHLKSGIFAHSNLVLTGLHAILDHNLKNS